MLIVAIDNDDDVADDVVDDDVVDDDVVVDDGDGT